MRRDSGFTLLEMMISLGLFIAGALFVYSTFAGVTTSSRSATLQIDLGSENKKSLTRLFSEMQASSTTPQDTDGLDSTDPEDVLLIEDDLGAPLPNTRAIIVNRGDVGTLATLNNGEWRLGDSRIQARERAINVSKSVRFRKVIGYRFNDSAGSIIPEWSDWITYRVNDRNQLIRERANGPTRIVANDVDALDAQVRPDGTVLVTMITAKRNPTGAGWRRYANSITIHPKN